MSEKACECLFSFVSMNPLLSVLIFPFILLCDYYAVDQGSCPIESILCFQSALLLWQLHFNMLTLFEKSYFINRLFVWIDVKVKILRSFSSQNFVCLFIFMRFFHSWFPFILYLLQSFPFWSFCLNLQFLFHAQHWNHCRLCLFFVLEKKTFMSCLGTYILIQYSFCKSIATVAVFIIILLMINPCLLYHVSI